MLALLDLLVDLVDPFDVVVGLLLGGVGLHAAAVVVHHGGFLVGVFFVFPVLCVWCGVIEAEGWG